MKTLYFDLEELAHANDCEPLDLLRKAYEWKWGKPPLEGTVARDLQRLATGSPVPDYLARYLAIFASSQTRPN